MELRNIVLLTCLSSSGLAAGGCAGGCEPILFEDEQRADIYGRVALEPRAKAALVDNDQINIAVDGLAVLVLTAREDVTLPDMVLDVPDELGASYEDGKVTIRPRVASEGQLRLLDVDTELVVVSVHVTTARVERITLYPNASPLGPALAAGPSFAVLDGTEVPLVAELRDSENKLLIDEALAWTFDSGRGSSVQNATRWDTWRLPSMPGESGTVTVVQGNTPWPYEVRSVDHVEALRAFGTFPHEWKSVVLNSIEASPAIEPDFMTAALDNLGVDPATRPDFRGLLEARWYCYQARTDNKTVFGVDWSFQPGDGLRVVGKSGPCALIGADGSGELTLAADGQELLVSIDSE